MSTHSSQQPFKVDNPIILLISQMRKLRPMLTKVVSTKAGCRVQTLNHDAMQLSKVNLLVQGPTQML